MSIDLSKMPKIGFGLMRLPENDGVIDIDKVSKMADSYLEAGFTYFDTAYVYHGGNSEKAVKEAIVKRYPRESFMLATKLPAWEMHNAEDADKAVSILNAAGEEAYILGEFIRRGITVAAEFHIVADAYNISEFLF